MSNLFGTLCRLRLHQRLFQHRLNVNAPWRAVNRFRVARLGVVVPYVDDTKLVVGTGMLMAALTIYIGLAEFEDMSFVLHLLTDEDLFGDVGADVGLYSILASGVRGAESVTIEPLATTIEALRRSIAILAVSWAYLRLVSVPNPENSTSARMKEPAIMSYKMGTGAVYLFSRSTRSSPHGRLFS